MRIYGLQVCGLNNGGRVLARNLVYRGITVRNLRVGYILANRVNSKAAWVCGTNLVKWIRYKAGDPIESKGNKGSVKFGVI